MSGLLGHFDQVIFATNGVVRDGAIGQMPSSFTYLVRASNLADPVPARQGRPGRRNLRRTVTWQLNIGESRHSLARKILPGHRGDIMHPYRAG